MQFESTYTTVTAGTKVIGDCGRVWAHQPANYPHKALDQ